MAERKLVYFVSDVHLGLRTVDPAEREARFIAFLKGLPAQEMRALYLLGDIWDFWYEYRDVIPREGARVVAALIGLMDAGVEVWFCPGNHDIWTYSYFEQLGMHRFEQPYYVTLDGKDFCLGHGDLLGGAKRGYKLMIKVFHNRAAQWLFSLLHPWMAYRGGTAVPLCRGGCPRPARGLLCLRALPRRGGPDAARRGAPFRAQGLDGRGDALRGVQRFFFRTSLSSVSC